MQQDNILEEGLRSKDLENMVSEIFEVDTYKSKMGEDKDVCVVTFQVKERAAARDLMEFIEKSFGFVLDSDVSSGENAEGDYFVFVEIERNERLSNQIKEMIYGVEKLTGINEWKFKYHKMPDLYEVSTDSLKNKIPTNPNVYEQYLTRFKTEGIKKFFNKTLMDDLTLENDLITIHKPFDQKIKIKLIKEGDETTILEGNEDKIRIDDQSTSEIFWLTKVLGDYNINKVGENFVLNNGREAMIINLEK